MAEEHIAGTAGAGRRVVGTGHRLAPRRRISVHQIGRIAQTDQSGDSPGGFSQDPLASRVPGLQHSHQFLPMRLQE